MTLKSLIWFISFKIQRNIEQFCMTDFLKAFVAAAAMWRINSIISQLWNVQSYVRQCKNSNISSEQFFLFKIQNYNAFTATRMHHPTSHLKDSTNFFISGNWTWSNSLIIWSIRIFCQWDQDFDNISHFQNKHFALKFKFRRNASKFPIFI